MNFAAFFQGYVECLVWSETDTTEDGDDRGNFQGREDRITKASLTKMEKDCRDFYEANLADLEMYEAEGRDDAHAGHDFCLTRNGHGAGFWDRGMEALGDRLSAAAKVYGNQGLYAARGWIYVY